MRLDIPSSSRRKNALRCLIILLGIFSFSTVSLPAVRVRPAGTIRGFVLDSGSRRGIEGVLLTVWPEGGEKSAERTAISDRGGAFSIPELPAGVYLCLFEREDYVSRTVENVRVAAGFPTRLETDLVRLPAALREEITVTAPALAENAGRTTGAVVIEGERLRRTPGSVDDVSRVLKSTVGLSQVNDISNELIVRGGSPWENAFFIDGIPFYDINHFQTQGGSGGMVGFINASWVRSMSFFKGGFPASFGDRMSSVIELNFREGDRERLRGQIDLNTAGFGGGAEGPILAARGSFLFSVKRSYHDIITGLIGYGVAPRLGDLHFKAVADLGSRHRLELLNVNAESRMAFDIERAVAEGFTRGLNYKTRQHTLGLSWIAGWSAVFSTVTTLSWSHFLNLDELEDVITRDAVYLMDETTDIVGLRHAGTLALGDRLRLSFGLETRTEIYDFNNIYGKAYSFAGTLLPKFVVRGDLRTMKTAAFASADWTPITNLSLSFGTRVDHFSHNRSTEPSPRVAASWQVRPHFLLKAAAGIFRQALPTAILGVSPATRNNRNPWAGHVLFGLSHEPVEGFLWTLDFYDKTYRRMPLTPEEPDFPVFDSCLGYGIYRSFTIVTDDGRARSRGFELTLEKKPGGLWHGVVGLSLSKSRFRDALGRWRDRLNDNRYILTVIGVIRLGRRWNIGLRSDLAGGVPYTPFDLERSREVNSAILDTSRMDAARYPDYISLSLRADREFRFQKTVLLAYVSVLNALNRKNVGRFYWDRISNKPGVIYQMPIIPVFGLEYRF